MFCQLTTQSRPIFRKRLVKSNQIQVRFPQIMGIQQPAENTAGEKKRNKQSVISAENSEKKREGSLAFFNFFICKHQRG